MLTAGGGAKDRSKGPQMRLILIASAVLIAGGAARAQDAGSFFSKFQVHGNLAQGFLFSSQNNYLTTNSSDGSAKWTEGA